MADAVSVDALAALETALTALLPPVVPAGLARRVQVRAQAVRPLGLGDYVGHHREPDAALQRAARRGAGRRRRQRRSDAAAQDYAATLAGQILAQTRADFAQRASTASAPSMRRRPRARVRRRLRICAGPGRGRRADHRTRARDLQQRHAVPHAPRGDFAGSSLALEPCRWPTSRRSPIRGGAAGAWIGLGHAAAAIVADRRHGRRPLTLADPQKAGAQLLWRPAAWR